MFVHQLGFFCLLTEKLVVFPAFASIVHRVTKVLDGRVQSLVTWRSGHGMPVTAKLSVQLMLAEAQALPSTRTPERVALPGPFDVQRLILILKEIGEESFHRTRFFRPYRRTHQYSDLRIESV